MVNSKPKLKRCKFCKRMIKVRVRKNSCDTGANAPDRAGSIKVRCIYSFYNHKDGNRLCRSSHRPFTEEYEK